MGEKPTTSAGGIVLRQVESNIFILIVERERDIEDKWKPILRQLPKGGCKHGETLEQTALREVIEETGYNVEIISKAGEAKWTYKRNNIVWDETVHYYFMRPTSLTPQEHDNEFDFIRWINIQEATNILSYPPERALILNILSEDKIPI